MKIAGKTKNPSSTVLIPTIEDIKQKIKEKYLNHEGQIDIRHLWNIESMHTFRVNWWRNSMIFDSVFITVETDKSIQIKESR